MAKSFKEMDFEWELLHPKGSPTDGQQQLDLNSFTSHAQGMEEELSLGSNYMNQTLVPYADEELSDEPEMGNEEICLEQAQFFHEKLLMGEVVGFEQSTDFEGGDEDDCDWGLKDLFIKEEEEGTADSRDAISLKKWLRSFVVAAATLSIFILGGGRAQLIGSNKKIQLPICTKDEKMKDSVQHQRAASQSFSWCGHYDERF